MNLVAKSDQTTGNQTYCSYVIQSSELVFSFTAAYSKEIDQSSTKLPHPGFDTDKANAFFRKHGLAVRAVGVLVADAERAFRIAVANGAIGILEPALLTDEVTGGKTKLAELALYGDVVLRLISNHGFSGPYLPNFEPVESLPISYGVRSLHHVVGSVSCLVDTAKYLGTFTGFHEVSISYDLGTAERGFNSLILSSENGKVILPMNEPVVGPEDECQIQKFLEQNEGAGSQHLAIACDDIFSTLKEMRMRSQIGGFDFMPGPPPTYYKNLASRVEGILTEKQCEECEELGILVSKDEHEVLLRVFSKPLGDRPTIFIEVIQRVVCGQQSTDGRLTQLGGWRQSCPCG